MTTNQKRYRTKLTRQKVFNKIARHLLAQGECCLSDDGECVYQRHDGKRCAAGCLVPDELLPCLMEGESAMGAHNKAVFLKIVRADALEVVKFGQRLHDSRASHPRDWPQGLRHFAELFGLRIPRDLRRALAPKEQAL